MNCYSTFLMTRKDLKDNVLNHRMNLLINYYTNEEKLEQINRQKLIQFTEYVLPLHIQMTWIKN